MAKSVPNRANNRNRNPILPEKSETQKMISDVASRTGQQRVIAVDKYGTSHKVEKPGAKRFK